MIKQVVWRWMRFEAFTAEEMYELLAIRQEVFVVEQNCAYLDADALDPTAWHLLGRGQSGSIAAYLRVNPPGTRFAEPSVGRLLTRASDRGKGLAQAAMEKAISKCRRDYPGMGIRISAQTYLTDFYNGFGFSACSPPYEEDGIPHVDMFKPFTP